MSPSLRDFGRRNVEEKNAYSKNRNYKRARSVFLCLYTTTGAGGRSALLRLRRSTRACILRRYATRRVVAPWRWRRCALLSGELAELPRLLRFWLLRPRLLNPRLLLPRLLLLR